MCFPPARELVYPVSLLGKYGCGKQNIYIFNKSSRRVAFCFLKIIRTPKIRCFPCKIIEPEPEIWYNIRVGNTLFKGKKTEPIPGKAGSVSITINFL